MKVQKEVRSMVEKAYTVLKNTHIFVNQLLVKTLNIKGSVGEGLEGNEEHAFGNWRKEDLCFIVAEVWLNCVPQLCGKQYV